VNPALGSLVAWTLGVHEFHQCLRRYSLTEKDQSQVLTKKEVKFALRMDKIMLTNLRVMRFLQEQCGGEPLQAFELRTNEDN